MTLDMATVPLEIWADWLEENGEDTALLRAMIHCGFAFNGADLHKRSDEMADVDNSDNKTRMGCGYAYRYGTSTAWGLGMPEYYQMLSWLDMVQTNSQ